eukprot:4907002-Prymnesium_polylepis.1
MWVYSHGGGHPKTVEALSRGPWMDGVRTHTPVCFYEQAKSATAVTLVLSPTSGEVGIDLNLASRERHTPLPRDRLVSSYNVRSHRGGTVGTRGGHGRA